jgi:quercetin 2,3-dioxygenase
MIKVRKSGDRGHLNHGWLDTHHTFSFGQYYDPDSMGFRALRVINEDVVAPGRGFGRHPHDNMEIISVVVSGAIEHRDSMGNGEVLRPGEVQYMSAGTGIEHSEFNPSKDEPLHLLQIWLMPNGENLTPTYAQKPFPFADRQDKLLLTASPDGRDGSIKIHSDAELYVSKLSAGKQVEHRANVLKNAWVQVISGEVDVNGNKLASGDGAAITGEESLKIRADKDADLLLFALK